MLYLNTAIKYKSMRKMNLSIEIILLFYTPIILVMDDLSEFSGDDFLNFDDVSEDEGCLDCSTLFLQNQPPKDDEYSFLDLPSEVKAMIIFYLQEEDVMNLYLTSKTTLDETVRHYDQNVQLLRKYKILGHVHQRWIYFFRSDGVRHVYCLKYLLASGLPKQCLNNSELLRNIWSHDYLEAFEFLLSIDIKPQLVNEGLFFSVSV